LFYFAVFTLSLIFWAISGIESLDMSQRVTGIRSTPPAKSTSTVTPCFSDL
jgi:hypothetical protein